MTICHLLGTCCYIYFEYYVVLLLNDIKSDLQSVNQFIVQYWVKALTLFHRLLYDSAYFRWMENININKLVLEVLHYYFWYKLLFNRIMHLPNLVFLMQRVSQPSRAGYWGSTWIATEGRLCSQSNESKIMCLSAF